MNPWNLIDSSEIPANGGELRLYRRADDYTIMLVGNGELMSSRTHGSEDALAELGCHHLLNSAKPRVLIGGLGIGFTLAAALAQLREEAEVVVAELVPAVVKWNRDYLGHFAGRPLDDPRTTVCVGDVALVLKGEPSGFDAIMLDVDNGPEGMTHSENSWLYSLQGLECAYRALRSNGVLSVWSAGPDHLFTERLRQTGFEVNEHQVRAHAKRKGPRHTIWVAQRTG